MAEISKIIPSAVVLPQCLCGYLGGGTFSRQPVLYFRPSHPLVMSVVVRLCSDMGELHSCTVVAKIKQMPLSVAISAQRENQSRISVHLTLMAGGSSLSLCHLTGPI